MGYKMERGLKSIDDITVSTDTNSYPVATVG